MPDKLTAPAPQLAPSEAQPNQRTPDYKANARELAERCIERARQNSARKLRDRTDWFNLLMYRGGANQWSIWNPNTNRFEERGTDPAQGGIPAYVSRCVTNVFGVKIDGVAAILDQTTPAKECGPGSPDDADRAAAEVATDAIPVLFDECGYERDRAQIHKLITLTSAVGYALYYDNDAKYGVDNIQAYQCSDPNCSELHRPMDVGDDGTCPTCGADTAPAVNPMNGQAIGFEYPKGKLCARVIHSFELSTPSGSRTTDTAKLPWVLTHTRLSWEEVFGRWSDLRDKLEADGKSGGGTPGAEYADAILGLVSPVGAQGASAAAPIGPVVYELWHDPIDDPDFYFPDGLYFVRVDDEVAASGPLPYTDEDGRPVKNVLIRQFAAAPGNASGKPPADDLAPLQVQRNIVESIVDLSLMHFAAPKEYIPLSVTLIDEPTGAPGERIRYRSTVPGEHPTIADGRGPSAALSERLVAIDQKMDEVSRLNAVLAGERPEGDPTLGEIQILQERGMSAFRAPLDALLQFEIDVAQLALRIARQTMWTERFYKVRGENGQWEVKQFLGADLAGRVDITIDKASAWPKSPLLHALRRKEAIEAGLVNVQDPEVASTLLSEMDLANLKPSLDVDRKQIARQIDIWKGAQMPQEITPPDALTQNLKLHFVLKQAFLKTEEAEAIAAQRPQVYQAMRAHLEQIQQLLAPPPMPTAPAPGAALDGLVKGGALKPVAPKGDVASNLVHAGVLKPKAPAGPAAPEAARA